MYNYNNNNNNSSLHCQHPHSVTPTHSPASVLMFLGFVPPTSGLPVAQRQCGARQQFGAF